MLVVAMLIVLRAGLPVTGDGGHQPVSSGVATAPADTGRADGLPQALEATQHAIEAAIGQLAVEQLEDVLGDTGAAGTGYRPTAVGPLELLAQHQQERNQWPILSGLPEEEKPSLAAAWGAAAAAVAECARPTVLLGGERARQAACYCVILPFLCTGDESWTSADVDALPPWLKQPEVLAALEDFALSAHRPMTACWLAWAARDPTESAITQPDATVYLEETGNRLLREGRYDDALPCLATASDLAERTGVEAAYAGAVFRLAEVMGDVGQALAAADRLQRLMDQVRSDETYAKAATLRLKHLYAAGRYAQVMEEGQKQAAATRCVSQRAGMLYLVWAAARRVPDPRAVAAAADEFLAEFPHNVLGVEIVLARAKDAMAEGDYGEADRLLEIVEERYSQSRVRDEATKLRERLRQAEKGP